MRVTFRIQRCDPERGIVPYFEQYQVEMEETDRVLDGLHQVKWQLDGTLALRRSCGHGICGSDAMVINGRNRLACKVLVKDVTQPITVEPMRGFAVLKDLIVDMGPFFEKYRAVKPYLMADEAPPARERLQTPAQRARYDDTTKCVLCGACTTACPSFWANGAFVGPAAIVNAHRFIFDSRDSRPAERLALLNTLHGIWRCRDVFNCTEACPRGIQVTKAIAQVRLAMLFGVRRGGPLSL